MNDADVYDKQHVKWLVNIHEVCGWPNMDSGMSYQNLMIRISVKWLKKCSRSFLKSS